MAEMRSDYSLKNVDFLETSFCLDAGLYKPFRKHNRKFAYIDATSNHSHVVLSSLQTEKAWKEFGIILSMEN